MPETAPLTANQIPLIRAELADWLTDAGPDGGPAVWSRALRPAEARQERESAAQWARSLRAAQLFYCTADMAHLARSAGLALPSYRLHPEELPAPHGMVVWETPVTDASGPGGEEFINAPVVAVSWAAYGGTVRIRTWTHREDWVRLMSKGSTRAGIEDLTPQQVRRLRASYPYPLVAMAASTMPFGKVPGWLRWAPQDTSGLSLVEMEDQARATDAIEQAERALIVTWLLMGQTLAASHQVEPSKSSGKHIRRIDPNLLTAVRYVQLRHRGTSEQAGVGEQRKGSGYQHRWIVRGHWRNHWYPSRQDHRPIWISDHIKGPDGAALLDPDKLVSVLRR